MFFRSQKREKIIVQDNAAANDQPDHKPKLKISSRLQTNIDNLNNLLAKPEDLNIRTLTFGDTDIQGAIAMIEGIVDPQSVHLGILGNLELDKNYPTESKQLFEFIYSEAIANSDVKKVNTFDDLSLSILSEYNSVIYRRYD